ncbi:hypothetical protein [Solibacillus sp. FSL K6-1523]|uniref:hypothetical protein n=1 Tax=Solibacillus sp. FSL K6-1523 TaxID=2921471 RepID=UPI0030FBA4C5
MGKKLRKYFFNFLLIITMMNFIKLIYDEAFDAPKPLLIYGYVAFFSITFVFIVIRNILKLLGEEKGKVEQIFKGLIFVLSVQLFIISIVVVSALSLMFSMGMMVILCIDFYQIFNNNKRKTVPPE